MRAMIYSTIICGGYTMMRSLVLALTLLAAGSTLPASAGPKENMAAVLDGIEKATGERPESMFGKSGCRDEAYCQADAGPIQIQVMGKIVELMPSSTIAPAKYRAMCATVFAALHGHMHLDLATEAVGQAFKEAAASGESKSELDKVQIEVSPTLSGSLLGCQFVKYGRN